MIQETKENLSCVAHEGEKLNLLKVSQRTDLRCFWGFTPLSHYCLSSCSAVAVEGGSPRCPALA